MWQVGAAVVAFTFKQLAVVTPLQRFADIAVQTRFATGIIDMLVTDVGYAQNLSQHSINVLK
jgi:hypothetical protein